MKRTCMNCKYYWSEIHNPKHPEQHKHNFCIMHERFLNKWNVYENLPYEKFDCGQTIFDDLESGISGCYMFAPEDEPFKPDEWFDENKRHNDELIK